MFPTALLASLVLITFIVIVSFVQYKRRKRKVRFKIVSISFFIFIGYWALYFLALICFHYELTTSCEPFFAYLRSEVAVTIVVYLLPVYLLGSFVEGIWNIRKNTKT